jgi:hypothetical protein
VDLSGHRASGCRVEEAEDSVLTEGRLAVVNDAEVPTARRGVVDRHTLSHQAAARLGFG